MQFYLKYLWKSDFNVCGCTHFTVHYYEICWYFVYYFFNDIPTSVNPHNKKELHKEQHIITEKKNILKKNWKVLNFKTPRNLTRHNERRRFSFGLIVLCNADGNFCFSTCELMDCCRIWRMTWLAGLAVIFEKQKKIFWNLLKEVQDAIGSLI